MSNDFLSAPEDLPMPIDDGEANHLLDMAIPDMPLPSTKGGSLSLATHANLLVLFIYPMTGVPGTDLPPGWDDMPGARGCTPQTCALRDAHGDISSYGAELIGMSCQTTDYQSEMTNRLGVDFPILSDADFAFAEALNLPDFTLNDVRYLKRITMIIKNAVIKAVHYPVFPSTADIEWLKTTLPEFSANR